MAYSDRELLARLIECEAGGEGENGMKAVAGVVMNRVHASGGEYARVGQGSIRKIIMNKKVSLRELVADKIVFALLLAVYYWMWARNDWRSFYPTIQYAVFGFTLYYFISRSLRLRKYRQEEPDEMAETNLRRCDALCLKVGAAAIVVLGFVCAIGRMTLTTEVIGYCLMGLLLLLAILRTVVFCLMDAKGY